MREWKRPERESNLIWSQIQYSAIGQSVCVIGNVYIHTHRVESFQLLGKSREKHDYCISNHAVQLVGHELMAKSFFSYLGALPVFFPSLVSHTYTIRCHRMSFISLLSKEIFISARHQLHLVIWCWQKDERIDQSESKSLFFFIDGIIAALCFDLSLLWILL